MNPKVLRMTADRRPGAGRTTTVAGAAAVLATLLAAMMLAPQGAFAHGLLLEQRDLPIPEWLFIWAAAVVLVVSFVAISIGWKTARFEEKNWRALPKWFSTVLLGLPTRILLGAFGVFMLGFTVWAALNGTESPDRNFSVTFVFVTFWLGVVVASTIFGDIFRNLNPWRAIAVAFAWFFGLLAGKPGKAPLKYPEKLGVWPSAVIVLLFGWLELIYGTPGFQAVGLTSSMVANATIIYTTFTLIGITLFGINTWLDRAEGFGVYFRMFASLSGFETRDGRIGIRRFLSGTTTWATMPGSVGLVLVVIAVTAYDGASGGAMSDPINTVFNWVQDLGFGPISANRIARTLFLLLTCGVVGLVYWGGIRGMHTVRSEHSTAQLGRLFIHAFIPIALAYLIAHYFTLLFFQTQAQFTYLLSDPLGDGSDWFGTADQGVDYAALGASFVWYLQVAALIAGHVIALVLGHDRALKVYGNARLAARSQYWMLAMMVAFTTLGLFLLAQIVT